MQPLIKSADPLRRYKLGNYLAILMHNIEAMGMIGYEYMVIVFDTTREGDDTQVPVLFITSEYSDFTKAEGHFVLGVFDGNGHQNHGHDAKWGELGHFEPAALELAAELLQVEEKPVFIPPPPSDIQH